MKKTRPVLVAKPMIGVSSNFWIKRDAIEVVDAQEWGLPEHYWFIDQWRVGNTCYDWVGPSGGPNVRRIEPSKGIDEIRERWLNGP